jgi:hexosaminidase
VVLVVIVAAAVIGIVAVAVAANVIVNSNGAPVVESPGTVVPAPVSRIDGTGAYLLTSSSAIAASGEARPVADYLAGVLRTATGLPLARAGNGTLIEDGAIVEGGTIVKDGTTPGGTAIVLAIEPGHPDGGYDLHVAEDGIRITASEPAGLFWGVQTLRQLVPIAADAESGWAIPATTISDYPRFAYRGAMLDVARHFFGVDDVKRYLDDLALLKINVLHLHLTDDQGWRIEVDGWPRLTEHGGSTQVGGGGGGHYTQDQYRDIVAYAASRYITIVPEIDLPGHTNAALASYPELTCDGVAPALYEGIEVGFSSLCIDNERTYEFVADVLGQVAALTPGPWIHIGGDEAHSTPEADYLAFAERAGAIAAATGKTIIGWHELGRSTALPPGTIGEYWGFTVPEGDSADRARTFVDRGGRLIMAPGDTAYLDMKYDESSPLGLVWAHGPTSVRESYEWDPAAIVDGMGDEQILGVEAPLWTETIATIDEVETMAFPRLASIAEIGWSPREPHGAGSTRDFAEFAPRLAALGTLLETLGIRYERADDIPWH